MRRLLTLVGPGILVAATGVGAGDLATAGFTGSQVGVACLWAVLVGAFLKFVLTEGLARWQLVTGKTLLEGALERYSRIVPWVFLPYLFLWTFFVGAALMSACGVTLHAIVPVFEDATQAKIVYGIAHSLLGLLLCRLGGFQLFERVMSVCIGLMFLAVTATAAELWPGTAEVARGLFVPSLDTLRGDALSWTVALMGGVGGTLTILCYGYWIREKGREGPGEIGNVRIDLGVGYLVTTIFGVGLVLIGSTVEVEGRGADLIVQLAGRLRERMGPGMQWAFLVGAWGAVFSSLLGVWQSVPYLFGDFWSRTRGGSPEKAYRSYMLLLTFLPMAGLFTSFRTIQKLYAIIGAGFLPLLALLLLILNADRGAMGRHANRRGAYLALGSTLVFFTWVLLRKLVEST